MINTSLKCPRQAFSGSLLVQMILSTVMVSCLGVSYAEGSDTVDKLSAAEKAKFVGAKFVPIKKVNALPAKVAEDLGVAGKDKTMADVGEDWSAGCVGGADMPRQRLLLAGSTADRCFVYFERGGYAHFEILRIYEYSPKEAKLIWERRFNKRFHDVDAIKTALSKDELN